MVRIASVLVALLCSSAAVGAADWQQSIAPEAHLGVRNRSPQGNYKATFEVDAPGGRAFRAVRVVSGDEFTSVRFPTDFATDFAPGKYRWRCVVDGKVVVRGAFQFERRANGAVLKVLD